MAKLWTSHYTLNYLISPSMFKAVQWERSHRMTSTQQMNSTENKVTFSILNAAVKMMDAPKGHYMS